jgi:hypothetical protein
MSKSLNIDNLSFIFEAIIDCFTFWLYFEIVSTHQRIDIRITIDTKECFLSFTCDCTIGSQLDNYKIYRYKENYQQILISFLL